MCSTSPLGVLLASQSTGFDSRLFFKQDSFGSSVYTSEQLNPGTTIVSCPFDYAITPTLAAKALHNFQNLNSDHQLLTTYLALHKHEGIDHGVELQHQVYVDSLPTMDELTTPSYWSEAELSLLHGTNLAPAVGERMQGWKEEWEEVVHKLGGIDLTWENYLWACTIISYSKFISTPRSASESITSPPDLEPSHLPSSTQTSSLLQLQLPFSSPA
ncbi:hypothetical protein P7C70_g9153, partial [Phenoliferia sp. Uapishka_3]